MIRRRNQDPPKIGSKVIQDTLVALKTLEIFLSLLLLLRRQLVKPLLEAPQSSSPFVDFSSQLSHVPMHHVYCTRRVVEVESRFRPRSIVVLVEEGFDALYVILVCLAAENGPEVLDVVRHERWLVSLRPFPEVGMLAEEGIYALHVLLPKLSSCRVCLGTNLLKLVKKYYVTLRSMLSLGC